MMLMTMAGLSCSVLLSFDLFRLKHTNELRDYTIRLLNPICLYMMTI